MDPEMKFYEYAYRLDEADSPSELLRTFGKLTVELFRLQYKGKVKLSKRLSSQLLKLLYDRRDVKEDLRRLASILEELKEEALSTKDSSTGWFLQFAAVALQRGLAKFIRYNSVVVRA